MSYPSSGPASIYDVGVPAHRPGGRHPAGPIGHARRRARAGRHARARERLSAGAAEDRAAQGEIHRHAAGCPNAESGKAPDGPRPAFLAPAGTINIARGKPVSSSDPEPIAGSLDLITDGDKEAADGTFVELGPEPQQITIDLQEPCEIYAVVVWHQHRWPRIYQRCRGADLPTTRPSRPACERSSTTMPTTRSASAPAGTCTYTETYEGKLIDGKSTRGRYVRCYSNGNTHDELNHYIEVEVYGRPLKSIKSN